MSAGGFQFGSSNMFSSNQPSTTAQSSQASALNPGGFSFGNTSANLVPSNVGTNTLPTTASSTSVTSAGIGFGAPVVAGHTNTGFGGLNFASGQLGSLGTTSTSSAAGVVSAPKLGLSGISTSTAATGLILSTNTAQSQASSLTSTSNTAVMTTTTTTSLSGAKPAAMSYRQLEDSINKWTLELEQQEMTFLEQATQINGWDRLLIDNGDKITQLHEDVECVKINQRQLDQELDFILGQQQELIDMLNPLEQAIDQLPNVEYQQHADIEREHVYKLTENIDTQLKTMAADLKEIVEHLSTSNRTQDLSDPLVQIAKILNTHVDSLQWVDHTSGTLQQRVDDIAKQLDLQRKQHHM